jgi:hypothetical protein
VKFTFTAAAGFSLSELGDSVVFQYGTALCEPHFWAPDPTPFVAAVPAPASIVLLGTGLVPALAVRRRLRRACPA